MFSESHVIRTSGSEGGLLYPKGPSPSSKSSKIKKKAAIPTTTTARIISKWTIPFWAEDLYVSAKYYVLEKLGRGHDVYTLIAVVFIVWYTKRSPLHLLT